MAVEISPSLQLHLDKLQRVAGDLLAAPGLAELRQKMQRLADEAGKVQSSELRAALQRIADSAAEASAAADISKLRTALQGIAAEATDVRLAGVLPPLHARFDLSVEAGGSAAVSPLQVVLFALDALGLKELGEQVAALVAEGDLTESAQTALIVALLLWLRVWMHPDK